MKADGKSEDEIIEMWGNEPLFNRFKLSQKEVDESGNAIDRHPIGLYYGRMGEKTYKWVIKKVCSDAGIFKPVSSASLRRTGVTLMKVFAGLSNKTVAKATKHKLKHR